MISLYFVAVSICCSIYCLKPKYRQSALLLSLYMNNIYCLVSFNFNIIPLYVYVKCKVNIEKLCQWCRIDSHFTNCNWNGNCRMNSNLKQNNSMSILFKFGTVYHSPSSFFSLMISWLLYFALSSPNSLLKVSYSVE